MGSRYEKAKDKLKQIMDQIAGEVDPEVDLVPEYCIKGKGDIFCYDPSQRTFVKVTGINSGLSKTIRATNCGDKQ